jgi:hypothetical protein
MSKPREYVVRTFSPSTEGVFDSTGVMSKLNTYKEATVAKQYAAIASLVRGDHSVEEVRHYASQANKHVAPNFQLNDQDSLLALANSNLLGLEVISFAISTDLINKSEVVKHGKEIRQIVQTWAEKSRVKGVRGFRANAIKSPYFEMNKDQGTYDLKFEAILSTAIFYNQNQATIVTLNNFLADIALFKKRLEKTIGDVTIFYEHSLLGIGQSV